MYVEVTTNTSVLLAAVSLEESITSKARKGRWTGQTDVAAFLSLVLSNANTYVFLAFSAEALL